MIFDFKKIKLSEEEMLKIISDYEFDDKNYAWPKWKEKFIDDQINGVMPSEKLVELLNNKFQIPCKIIDNVKTVDIEPPAFAVLDNGKDKYHAIYIKNIDLVENTVTYMDPSTDQNISSESVNKIDEYRRVKQNNNEEVYAGLIIPIL